VNASIFLIWLTGALAGSMLLFSIAVVDRGGTHRVSRAAWKHYSRWQGRA
jgi:hypothetical protein